MNFLFIHQNFPGQFKHLSRALAAQKHRVVALTPRVKERAEWGGVTILPYKIEASTGKDTHRWLTDLDTKMKRADYCWRAARKLKDAGYMPDVIIAHPGWGESLFLKDVWPDAKLGLYCELYHHADYPHLGFDPEFPIKDPEADVLRIRLKNQNMLMHLPICDAAISPTAYQASTFPKEWQKLITVTHDGVDTNALRANPDATYKLDDGRVLTRENEVITFVNRNLEPYRGYHIFMRALPEILRTRPNAEILVVGGDGTSYGAKPKDGRSWKRIFLDEVKDQISESDWERVHFLGRIPYDRFVSMLQVSRAHLYLTYPFVLSWSVIETMSVQGALIASNTAPVAEVLEHDKTARLFDFFDREALVEELNNVLDDKELQDRLGQAARAKAVAEYDLRTVCMPNQMDWVKRLVGS
jgi:glycosyltransferase involved in cell wall biosynthesis